MEPTAQQSSYADILRLSKPGTKESTTKKNRKNSLSKRKWTITITRTNDDQLPADPLTIRHALNSTLRDSQAPPNAVISAAAVNRKNNYVLASREDCPAATILEYKEIPQSTLQRLDNTATAMQPRKHGPRSPYMESTFSPTRMTPPAWHSSRRNWKPTTTSA